MSERIDYENIFTPQGMLGHVSKTLTSISS